VDMHLSQEIYLSTQATGRARMTLRGLCLRQNFRASGGWPTGPWRFSSTSRIDWAFEAGSVGAIRSWGG
jgi:hypothetical protein